MLGWLLTAAFAQGRVDPPSDLYAFLEMRITGAPQGSSQKADDRALTDSMHRMEKALTAIQEVREERLGTPLGATDRVTLNYELALAFGHLAEAIRTSPPPFYLTADQVELYTTVLEDRASACDGRERTTLAAAVSAGVDGGLLCQPEQLAAVERLSVIAPEPWAAVRSLPTLDPVVCAQAARRGEPLPALRSGDPHRALSLMPPGPSVQRAVALELGGEAHAAGRIWETLGSSLDRSVVGSAAAFYLRQGDVRRARKLADVARGGAFAGQPPSPELEAVARALDDRDRQERRKADEKQSSEAQLTELREATAALGAAADRCPGLPSSDEVQLSLEQARLVIEAGDHELAPDVLTLIQAMHAAVVEVCGP